MKTFKVELINSQLIRVDGESITPEESQQVYNHSPDGFSWGYEGSGCAQTALAILLYLFGYDVAAMFYQDFKRTFIAPLEHSQLGNNPQVFEFTEEWLLEQFLKPYKGGNDGGEL